MIETGRVIKTEGNIAFIELEKRTACGYCHACDMKQGANILKVVNTKEARVDNKVQVSISEWNMVKIAFLVYIVPLILFVIAYLAGDSIARSYTDKTDQFILLGMGTAIVTLFFYYIVMKLYDKHYRNGLSNKPFISSVLD